MHNGQKTNDVLEQNALADAALADNGRNLPLVDGQIHTLEHGIVAEALEHVIKLDQRHGHRRLTARTKSTHSRRP